MSQFVLLSLKFGMLTSYLCFNSSAGRFEQNGRGMLLHLSYRVVVCVLLYKAL